MERVAILGATGSIGSAIARRLSGKGRGVLLVGRNEDKLSALSQELGQPYVCVDFTTSAAL